MSQSKVYVVRMMQDSPTTINNCTCLRAWKLATAPACATPHNAYCCNPSHDAAGAWCLTREGCRHGHWDRCVPRPLHTTLQVLDAGARIIRGAHLVAGFTQGLDIDSNGSIVCVCVRVP